MQEHWRHARLETVAVHAGRVIDPNNGAVADGIQLSTTFARDSAGELRQGYSYIRADNPNRRALEIALAQLEGGTSAAVFSSGMAATMSVFQTLQKGDRVIAPADCYYGIAKLLKEVFARWGLETSFVDMSDERALAAAFNEPVQLVWVETPSNPLLKIVDIAQIAQRAHDAGAVCVCDNTISPGLQRPLDLGADAVMHSTTKYIGGHSDVAGGALIVREESPFWARLRTLQAEGGAVPSPFDAWLVLRGLRTLPWRMRAHSQNALAVAEFLVRHPKVERVFYPGLAEHPRHQLAARQMRDFSGLLSFQLRAGRAAAQRIAARTKLFVCATSIGGVESLIEHRASVEGPATRAPENLLRLSVGLEHPEDLIADLEQALAANESD